MNLEHWLYQRDIAEYVLAIPGINHAPFLAIQEEAEQEIERILRAPDYEYLHRKGECHICDSQRHINSEKS